MSLFILHIDSQQHLGIARERTQTSQWDKTYSTEFILSPPARDMETRKDPRCVPRNIAIIACIVVAEPLASTSLLPFVYFMVKGFGYEETQIGARAGIISMHDSYVSRLLTSC